VGSDHGKHAEDEQELTSVPHGKLPHFRDWIAAGAASRFLVRLRAM
jgi:hypothetical protein